MIIRFLNSRAAVLLAAFAAGSLLTALLLPGSYTGDDSVIFKMKITELENRIADRNKQEKSLAARELTLAARMVLEQKNTAQAQADTARLSKNTALAQKRLAHLEKRKKENEPVINGAANDRDLVNRLDRLLAGTDAAAGEAG